MLLQLIVLGKIPGTNVQVDFDFVVSALLALACLVAAYYTLRHAARHPMTQHPKQPKQLELISL